MADIVDTAVSPNACSHFVVGGTDDGEAWSIPVHDSELLVPLTADEKLILRRLLLRRLRQKGISITQFIRRVVRGEEATNMKTYQLLGNGVAITKTNIGTAYQNISPRLNGERMLVDFTGCTEFIIKGCVNFVGVGPFGIRVVRDSDNAVLFENSALAQTGERELDTGWLPLPGAAVGMYYVRAQAKSATAADDPVFGGIAMVVR